MRVCRLKESSAAAKSPHVLAARPSPLSPYNAAVECSGHILRGFAAGCYWPFGLFDLALNEVQLGSADAVLARAERLVGPVQNVETEPLLDVGNAPPDQRSSTLETFAGVEGFAFGEHEGRRWRAESPHLS